MSTPTTPTTVEPGQIWRDNDQRTRGAGEFTVEKVTATHAFVRRHRTGRLTRIYLARLLNGNNTQRGYTYLGMSR